MYGWFASERWIFRTSYSRLGLRRSEDFASLVLFGALLLAGLMLLVHGLDHYNRAQEVASWPTATGRVLQAGIEPVPADGALKWRPMLRYVYQVRNQTVISNGISLATARDSYSEYDAKRIVEQYAPNTTVVVSYNPDRIGEAVLEHSVPGFAWFCLFAGLVLTSVGGARVLLAYRTFWR
jgi:uncharacterized protein DUF3592